MELPVKNHQYFQILDRLYIKIRQSVDIFLLPFDLTYDLWMFLTNCRLSPTVARGQKDTYDLIFFSHTIEKGLSLPAPKILFGKNNICRILHILRSCDPYSVDKIALQMAIGCLDEYINFHREKNIFDNFLNSLSEEIENLLHRFQVSGLGGTKDVTKILEQLQGNNSTYQDFLISRYSCRSFSDDPVPKDTLIRLVEIAQQAPSQCNRQSTRVHIYQNKGQIQKLLLLQGGSRGFSEDISTLLVITNDLNSWVSRGERNQCYLDSGLFSMALLYAAHSLGLGACPLNFSKTNLVERKFRKSALIPGNERVVMLVALGFISPNKKVAARSVRRIAQDVLCIH